MYNVYIVYGIYSFTNLCISGLKSPAKIVHFTKKKQKAKNKKIIRMIWSIEGGGGGALKIR